ncbi:hypothetical protein [Streptomyces sp. 900105245]|uniref:hypothetical protein n=1 Tax=Streptomyces sp. 900105245 TaxID=3154379 RepID=UPI00332CD4D1
MDPPRRAAPAHTGVTRLPLWLVPGHEALAAVTGLAAWTAQVVGGVRSSAWAVCAVVLIVAAFGFMTLPRRLPSSGRHSQGGAAADRHFPLTAVVAHGATAGVYDRAQPPMSEDATVR